MQKMILYTSATVYAQPGSILEVADTTPLQHSLTDASNDCEVCI